MVALLSADIPEAGHAHPKPCSLPGSEAVRVRRVNHQAGLHVWGFG